MYAWLSASNHQELKEGPYSVTTGLLTLTLKPGTPSESLMGRALKDIPLPEGTLIALVRRGSEVVIPRGATVKSRVVCKSERKLLDASVRLPWRPPSVREA